MNKKLTLVIFFTLFVLISHAQPGPPPAPCWPPPCVPIDGGITLISFIAALFGYFTLSDKSKV